MVERLAEIHNDLGVHGDTKRIDAEYAAAFREYGVNLDAADPAEAGARLAASPVAAELANALDQWVFIRRGRLHGGTRPGHAATASRRQGRRPRAWRNRLRDTLGRMTADRAAQLDDLERLAATADVDRLPEASVTRLASALSSLGRREIAVRPAPARPAVASGRLLGQCRPRPGAREFRPARRGGPLFRRRRRHPPAERPRPRIPSARPSQQSGQLGGSGRDLPPTDRAPPRRRARPRPARSRAAEIWARPGLLMSNSPRPSDLKPADWKIRNSIGTARADAGDWNAAIEDRREAVQLEPSLPLTHNALGFTLLAPAAPTRPSPPFARRSASTPDSRRLTSVWSGPAGQGRLRARPGMWSAAAIIDVLARPQPRRSLRRAQGRADDRPGRPASRPSARQGPARSTPVRSAEFAQLCFSKKLYAASARLWSESFAARPELARRRDPREPLSGRSCARPWLAAAWARRSFTLTMRPEHDCAIKRSRWLTRNSRPSLQLLRKRHAPGTWRDSETPRSLASDPAWVGLARRSGPDTLPVSERRAFRELWSGVERLRQQSGGRAR